MPKTTRGRPAAGTRPTPSPATGLARTGHPALPGADRPPALPLADGRPTALRADAARNRTKLLAAAAALIREKGVDGVSLDEIVAAAGVGKGTLFRIFGDKSGLAAALLDDRERQLQQRILFGPPPVGPGAGPGERIGGFVTVYVGYVADHVDLVRMSQTARQGARFDTGAHQFWRTHLAYLAGEAGHPDPRLVADVILAAVTAEQVGRWIGREGRTPATLGNSLAGLARQLCATPEPEPAPPAQD